MPFIRQKKLRPEREFFQCASGCTLGMCFACGAFSKSRISEGSAYPLRVALAAVIIGPGFLA
jgi:hypothetical protein